MCLYCIIHARFGVRKASAVGDGFGARLRSGLGPFTNHFSFDCYLLCQPSLLSVSCFLGELKADLRCDRIVFFRFL